MCLTVYCKSIIFLVEFRPLSSRSVDELMSVGVCRALDGPNDLITSCKSQCGMVILL